MEVTDWNTALLEKGGAALQLTFAEPVLWIVYLFYNVSTPKKKPCSVLNTLLTLVHLSSYKNYPHQKFSQADKHPRGLFKKIWYNTLSSAAVAGRMILT